MRVFLTYLAWKHFIDFILNDFSQFFCRFFAKDVAFGQRSLQFAYCHSQLLETDFFLRQAIRFSECDLVEERKVAHNLLL